MKMQQLKDICFGREIVICGAGPSLNDYKPIKGAVHIALNRAVLKQDIHFDYMICVDYTSVYHIRDYLEQAHDLVKLFGSVKAPENAIIPDEFMSMERVIPFQVADEIGKTEWHGDFVADVGLIPLRYHQSVATTALQIALYMNPKTIYLVGLDFSDQGHFTKKGENKADSVKHTEWVKTHWAGNSVRELWRRLAEFAARSYPDVRIVSVNPVTLEGIFMDQFTKMSSEEQKVLAYIPVKEHSVRLPGKNILPFGDSNLLIHKIRQLKKVKSISKVVVSTDSQEMLRMAREEGVIGIERPKDLANESRPYCDYVNYLTEVLDGDHIMRCPVTAPLCSEDVFEDSIRVYFQKLQEGYDSLTSVVRFQHHMIDENGPMNFSMGSDHKGSQNLPVWFLIANCMDIEPKSVMKKHLFQYGEKVYRYEVDAVTATDIDDGKDYYVACTIHQYMEQHGPWK